MKKVLLFLLLLSFTLLFQSCLKDSCTEKREFVQFTPVYLTKAQFRLDTRMDAGQSLENPGKFYFYNNYLFINDQGKGIHVYDVRNESQPTKLGFYNIPGNFDMAIKENVLYADNVIDLIALDISNVTAPKLIKRIEDYNGLYKTYDPNLYYAYSIRSNVTNILDCSDPNFNNRTWVNIANGSLFFDKTSSPSSSVINSNASTGVGGSFARFTVVNDYLYVVDQYTLKSYSITDPSNPVLKNTNQMGWGIETIFPYKNKLFIGSTSGMYIFDNTKPETPSLQSRFEHARACDPVVAEDNTAYVTLRSGTRCLGFENQLDIIDITNVLNPKLIKTYPMKNPHGVAVRNGYLYLAEGVYGFKILNVKDPKNVETLSEVTGVHSYDMISISTDRLFMIGDDGFYLYNVADPKKPTLVSNIKKDKK
jgi:hypothetical protein